MKELKAKEYKRFEDIKQIRADGIDCESFSHFADGRKVEKR